MSEHKKLNLFAKIILHILSNALAILLAVKLVRGINMDISLFNLLIAGTLLGIVNTFIRPILKLLSFPFIILTFGLFSVIINIVLLFFVSFLLPSFSIETLWAALWGVIIISFVNYIISFFIKD